MIISKKVTTTFTNQRSDNVLIQLWKDVLGLIKTIMRSLISIADLARPRRLFRYLQGQHPEQNQSNECDNFNKITHTSGFKRNKIRIDFSFDLFHYL